MGRAAPPVGNSWEPPLHRPRLKLGIYPTVSGPRACALSLGPEETLRDRFPFPFFPGRATLQNPFHPSVAEDPSPIPSEKVLLRPWVCQYPDVEPVSPGGDSVAGRSAAACVGEERRGPLGRGARGTPGGTTAAHGGGGGPGPRAPIPERGAGGGKRPAVKLASRCPRRPPRASLPRPTALPALPAGGERGFLAAVAVARSGSPEEAEESPPTTLSSLPARRRHLLGAAAGGSPV